MNSSNLLKHNFENPEIYKSMIVKRTKDSKLQDQVSVPAFMNPEITISMMYKYRDDSKTHDKISVPTFRNLEIIKRLEVRLVPLEELPECVRALSRVNAQVGTQYSCGKAEDPSPKVENEDSEDLDANFLDDEGADRYIEPKKIHIPPDVGQYIKFCTSVRKPKNVVKRKKGSISKRKPKYFK